MTLCRFLRWKALYGAGITDPSQALELAARNDVPFSCLKSCRPWGPDESPAVPEDCGPERVCFEEARFGSEDDPPVA